MTTLPKTRMLQFAVSGVVGVVWGQNDQNNKKMLYIHAKILLSVPNGSGILHGPHLKSPEFRASVDVR
jgi:hypothetical protein